MGSLLGATAPSDWARLRKKSLKLCGNLFGTFWYIFGTSLNIFWAHLGSQLGLTWVSLGVSLGPELFSVLNIRQLVGHLFTCCLLLPYSRFCLHFLMISGPIQGLFSMFLGVHGNLGNGAPVCMGA